MSDVPAVVNRSIDELLSMIVPSSPHVCVRDLIDRAGGIEALAMADPLEIAGHLEGREIDARDFKERTRRARSTRKRSHALRSAEVLAASFELGRRAAIARARVPEKVTSPSDVAEWATPRITSLSHEELWLIAIDARGHVRATRCLARGGLHGAAVRAADPLRVALRVDASAFVLVHNHPSGDPTPSKEDIALTIDVAAAGQIVHVPLVDHIVVARSGHQCVPFPRDLSDQDRDRDRDGNAR
jgi:hypothetical protein